MQYDPEVLVRRALHHDWNQHPHVMARMFSWLRHGVPTLCWDQRQVPLTPAEMTHARLEKLDRRERARLLRLGQPVRSMDVSLAVDLIQHLDQCARAASLTGSNPCLVVSSGPVLLPQPGEPVDVYIHDPSDLSDVRSRFVAIDCDVPEAVQSHLLDLIRNRDGFSFCLTFRIFISLDTFVRLQ